MLTLPPPGSELREMFDVSILATPRKLPSFEQAELAANNFLKKDKAAVSVNSVIFNYADGCVYLVRFYRRGSLTLHVFGKP